MMIEARRDGHAEAQQVNNNVEKLEEKYQPFNCDEQTIV